MTETATRYGECRVCKRGLHPNDSICQACYYEEQLKEEEERANKLEEKLIHYRYENSVFGDALLKFRDLLATNSESVASILFSLKQDKQLNKLFSLIDETTNPAENKKSNEFLSGKIDELKQEVSSLTKQKDFLLDDLKIASEINIKLIEENKYLRERQLVYKDD